MREHLVVLLTGQISHTKQCLDLSKLSMSYCIRHLLILFVSMSAVLLLCLAVTLTKNQECHNLLSGVKLSVKTVLCYFANKGDSIAFRLPAYLCNMEK